MRKERSILFSTDMVQAILEGRKTMTRRICKDQESANMVAGDETLYQFFLHSCPYGQPGDILWVRETFTDDIDRSDDQFWPGGRQPEIFYKADFDKDHYWMECWKPSIHMPKAAARIWLEITDIRAERLQDITDEDAIREGIEEVEPDAFGFKYKGYDGKLNCLLPKTSFFTLFEKINGEGSYGKNPWLWVISFQVLSTTGRPRMCRECGCTDMDCSQCIEKTGEPCHWVEEDLCSACSTENRK